MIEQAPKFPDNPSHANGTCEECGEPCQVYGCRWCPGCYDAASAALREARRVPKAQTAVEWAASLSTLACQPLPIDQPCPYQRAALAALGVRAPAVPAAAIVGLPLVVERGVPASTMFLLAARPGRTGAMFNALRLVLVDEQDDQESPA